MVVEAVAAEVVMTAAALAALGVGVREAAELRETGRGRLVRLSSTFRLAIYVRECLMKRGLVVGLGIVGVFVVLLLLVFGSYVSAKNQMVAKDQAVKTAWSQVDIVLQRRADLIPNLVATVKGFATHEETVFGDIANARAGLLNARDPQAKMAANGQLDSAFGRLLALSENYPELKSNQNFLSLQTQLEGSENRIATERKRYNLSLIHI